jgi:hypothetical protein
MATDDVRLAQYREQWEEEMESAYVYRVMASVTKGEQGQIYE